MISWITNNIGTIAAAVILVAIIAVASIIVIRDKKKGRSACGCNCEHCAMGCSCHKSK